MTPVGYSRTAFTWRNEMMRPLDDDDARGLLGCEISVMLGESVKSTSTITNARILDDGARMEVTAEAGGRWCPACERVYPPGSEHLLAPLEDLRQRMPTLFNSAVYDNHPPWTRVCRDNANCLYQRMDN